ncbi:MAG: magnesium chelatase [Planctomycetota bacterium]|nr:magnesium chelatase [Planctomycetota bacterium]
MSTPAAAPQTFPSTLGDLRRSGYRYRSVKQELRENVLRRLAAGGSVFPGLVGYEDTVVPQMVQSILSRHDTLLLGLRGQAKTRMLRATASLLDEWIPLIDGAAHGLDLPDDPLVPGTRGGRRIVAEMGDLTPIRWMHRADRYHEKLATPDVTIADLIGEIDLVKHAEGRYLSDESTMHFGLVPRSNRGLFAINELPDLAPRIQVGLFNVLEERDVQIRGYPVRLELDVCLMFSANPEDYTNRGRIVTPLKDRIGSVVRTHYPSDNREAMRITRENAFVERGERAGGAPAPGASGGDAAEFGGFCTWAAPAAPEVDVPPAMHEILEETIRLARKSPHINQASGVSVRASIAALECLVSAAELRGVTTGEARVAARVVDAEHLAAALRGKIELMIAEDAPDGSSTEDKLIAAIFGEAVKSIVGRHLQLDAVESVAEPFSRGLKLQLDDATSAAGAIESMKHVEGLLPAAKVLCKRLEMAADDAQSLACAGELVLEFLYVHNRLSKLAGKRGRGYTR